MARRRMINKVRTDTLEGKIAHYKALGNYDAAFAIEALARQIGAPIDAAAIDAQVAKRRAVYQSEGRAMTAQELGAMGEYYAAQVLRSVGLDVEHGGPADLLAEGVPIEVKAARPGRYRTGGYRGYQFCLTKPGHTDHSKAAVVVLLCFWHTEREPVAFIIPTEALGNRRKLVIPGQPWTYTGRWARYYRRWEVLADVMEGGDRL